MDLAQEFRHELEHLRMSLAQISEQLLDFRDFGQSLSRLERSVESLRLGAHPSMPSMPLNPVKDRISQSSGIAPLKEARAKLGEQSPSQLSERTDSTPSMYKMMDLLEEHTARKLRGKLRRGKSTLASVESVSSVDFRRELAQAGPKGSSDSTPVAPVPPFHKTSSFSCVSVDEPVQPVPNTRSVVLRTGALGQSASKQDMVRLLRRKSLDELRASHDAIITAAAPQKDDVIFAPRLPESLAETRMSALSRTGWLLLSMVGILDFFEGTAWRVLTRCILLLQMLGLAALAFVLGSWRGPVAEIEPLITTALYLLGALMATLSLRRSHITRLLGPAEHVLDEYAADCDFLDDWRKLSQARLWQIGSFFVLMLGSRSAALFLTSDPGYGKLVHDPLVDGATMVAFTVMAACYSTTCFCTLHLTAGLELAVDSFAVRCFQNGSPEEAVLDWNVVQATLRQTSGKLSDFLVVLATSCIAASILFAYQVVSLNLSASGFAFLDILLWTGWLYPPVLLFLYTLSSAAAVTGKVDRLAPLVNSWAFDDKEVLDDARRYVVQYILDSQAGFYTRGVRVTAFSVQKICYYFAAGSFTLLANLWQ